MNKTIFKMAVKNLFANKAKMIITLSLIGIGTFLVILGLGILNFAIKQTKNVCISDFSGDILITGKPEKEGVGVQLLGTFQTISVSLSVPKMPYVMPFQKIKNKIEEFSEVKSTAQSAVTRGMIKPTDLPDSWKPDEKVESSYPFCSYLGIIPLDYKNTFDTVRVYEGEYPLTNEGHFALLPRKLKENYEKYYARKLNIGDIILIHSFGAKSRQQKVTVTGFFDYAHPDTAITGIAYIDIDTCRILSGMTLGARTASAIPDSIDLSLSEKSEEELFASIEQDEDIEEAESADQVTDFENILGSTDLRDQLNLADNEAWHHIAVKLHDGSKTESMIKILNKWFESEGLKVQAVDWETAMHNYASAIGATRVLFITMLIILSVVVLIVIMNTLVVAVMQRTAEIGTMRAIGAKKSFVRKIFFTESVFMSFVGVLIGLILALIGSIIVNSFNISLNEILSAMFGGKKIQVSISLMSVLGTMAAMLTAGTIANLYPVRLALQISPLEAINR